MVDLLTPREGALRAVRDRLGDALETVVGGTFDGEKVATKATIDKAFDEPLPPASENAAEVLTPARIVVSAVCPRCELPATIALTVSTELVVDSMGSTIRLKGKSKTASHICGQTTLFDPASQGTFDLTDIIGNESEAGDDSES